ncbi:MAG TPA: hypothetical protein PLV68_08315 [Ilumatobacteraceae bacterium]|nr:hypothetical protein [Ilumatobacteraceae bacterium]
MLYEYQGRAVAYGAAAALMVVLIVTGMWLAGPQHLRRSSVTAGVETSSPAPQPTA